MKEFDLSKKIWLVIHLRPEREVCKIEDVKEFIEKLPNGIVELKKGKLVLKDINQLPVLESYIDREKIDFINITRDSTKYIFSFETDGSYTAKNALIESANILEKKYILCRRSGREAE